MSNRVPVPETPAVVPGVWRYRDDTPDQKGIRIYCGDRHIFISAQHAYTIADALVDLADEQEHHE